MLNNYFYNSPVSRFELDRSYDLIGINGFSCISVLLANDKIGGYIGLKKCNTKTETSTGNNGTIKWENQKLTKEGSHSSWTLIYSFNFIIFS